MRNIKLSDVREGSTVRVDTYINGTVTGTVDEVEEDVKNGMPGISYTTTNGDGHWCYLDQIARVVKY